MIAALFVQAGGCYFGLPDVDPWNEESATPLAFRDLLISIAATADMANRPPAITGGIQANQSPVDGSLHRTLRPQGETTRSGSPASPAAWTMPRRTE